MSGKIEGPIMKKLIKKYKSKYIIKSSLKGGKNGLPEKSSDKIYFPDLILLDKRSRKIKHIIEVETDPVRKALVGGAILADYCIGIDQPKNKPQLSFIIGNKTTKSGRKGLKQLPNFKERGIVIEKHLKYIRIPVNIDTENEIIKKIR